MEYRDVILSNILNAAFEDGVVRKIRPTGVSKASYLELFADSDWSQFESDRESLINLKECFSSGENKNVAALMVAVDCVCRIAEANTGQSMQWLVDEIEAKYGLQRKKHEETLDIGCLVEALLLFGSSKKQAHISIAEWLGLGETKVRDAQIWLRKSTFSMHTKERLMLYSNEVGGLGSIDRINRLSKIKRLRSVGAFPSKDKKANRAFRSYASEEFANIYPKACASLVDCIQCGSKDEFSLLLCEETDKSILMFCENLKLFIFD